MIGEFDFEGEKVVIDADLDFELNVLARILYKADGYATKDDKDMGQSEHPTERHMYQQALRCYMHCQNTGFGI
jgi:hypothetical protein